MPGTVFLPRDAAARAVGADEVALALTHQTDVEVVRTGSRGMLWLEPLLEVELDGVRVGYGPLEAHQVPGVMGAIAAGVEHPLYVGPVEQHPWIARQTRTVTARLGVVDPDSLDDHLAHGGHEGLRAALAATRAHVVSEVTASGLRGRGGAGFPTGIKWRAVADAPGGVKYVCANADEGDSGTFADRMVMEGDPFRLIEGMTIAGYAVGATEGWIYIRSEYPDAIATMRRAVDTARERGYLGRGIMGGALDFDIRIRVGAGAYVCGEETSMLESMEGRRGVVRPKPPLPAHSGLFGRPTLVNNVMTLCAVPDILTRGSAWYAQLGSGRSRGTQVFQLAGNVHRGGLVEVAFGLTLEALVHEWGGGTHTGRPVRAVQVGGPLGGYLPPERFGLPLDYEALAEAGALLGHGGVVVFDDTVDMAAMARLAMEFCAAESCGRCTPCRIGSVRGVETLDRIRAGDDPAGNRALLDDLCAVMEGASLCALGGLTPLPVRSALRYFPEDFHLEDTP